MKYLQDNDDNQCPICAILIHETNPFEMLRYLLLVILLDILHTADIPSLGFLEKPSEPPHPEPSCTGLTFGGSFLLGIFIYFYPMDINPCKLLL